jgi:hypothetical protein
VKGKPGMIALDNEDGTFNVEFDDGDEADAPAAQLELAIDQSLDDLRGHMSGWPRELASGIRVVDPFKLPPKPSPVRPRGSDSPRASRRIGRGDAAGAKKIRLGQTLETR